MGRKGGSIPPPEKYTGKANGAPTVANVIGVVVSLNCLYIKNLIESTDRGPGTKWEYITICKQTWTVEGV